MKNKCDVCDQIPSRYNNIFNKYLCKDCNQLPEYKIICKTTAKNKYFLTDKDIKNIETFEKRGYTGYKNIFILMKEIDVIDYFCAKHEISDNQIEHVISMLADKKEEKSQKRKEKKNLEMEKRKKNLVKALKNKKLKLRSDSKLCAGYINGTIKNYTIEEVVERMCQMKFLYEYANMDECLMEAREYQKEELEAGYFPDCTIFEQAEMNALKKVKGYPDKWPWL